MIRYLTAGESHGEALIGIVEGVPAGIPLVAEDINKHLSRRWLGYGRGGRAKFEQDLIHFYSGVRFSKTMGSPISMRLDNAAYFKDKPFAESEAKTLLEVCTCVYISVPVCLCVTKQN